MRLSARADRGTIEQTNGYNDVRQSKYGGIIILRLPDNPAGNSIWVDIDLYAVCALRFTDIEGR